MKHVRAAIYARVSSQAQRERHTIENQLRELPAFIAAQGWTLAGTYVDDGRSAKAGKLDARDGFAKLVQDAEARKFDILVVVDIDRLTRTSDMIERASILGPFQRLGIDIVTPTGGRFDLDSMIGGLYVELQARFAAEENRKRAERIKAGKLRAVAEGRKPAGPTPYGLAYDRATGTWSLHPEHAEIAREMVRRVIAGEACSAIADDMFSRGVSGARGRSTWSRHWVWEVVRSTHLYGLWVAGKAKKLSVRVPPIVDEATWQAAQDSLIAHGKRGLRKTKHVYLLEGLATCAACGSPIAIRSPCGERKADGSRHPAAYVCKARKLALRDKPRCAAPIVLVADADARVWDAIARELCDAELAERLAERDANRARDRRDWSADAKGYRSHLERLARVETALMTRFRRGAISEQAMDAELAAAARERAAVVAQLAAAELAQKAAPAAAPVDWAAALPRLATAATLTQQREVVQLLVEKGGAIVDNGRVILTIAPEAAASRDAGGDSHVVLAAAAG